MMTWRQKSLIAPMLLLIAGQAGAVSYSGSLGYGNGLNATAQWADNQTQLDWNVQWDFQQQLWVYTYELRVAGGKEISHAIVETSDNIDGFYAYTTDFSIEDDALGDWTPNDGNSNPNMPDDIFGLKLDLDEERTSIQIVITTERDPVIGDFYAKGGRGQGRGKPVDTDYNSVWNSGFGVYDIDPVLQSLDDYVNYPGHLLVPNHTSYGPPDDPQGPPELMPEPVSAVALIASLGGLGGYLRRRRRAG